MRAWVFLTAAVTLSAALATHIAVWRVRRPAADGVALLGLMLVLPALGFGVAAAACAAGWAETRPDEVLAASLLHFALAAAYVQTYPASQARSPSLQIILILGRAPGGLTRSDLLAALPAGELVKSRLDDLETNALVRREGERLALRPPGRALATLFSTYRRLLGLPIGGG